MELANPHTSSRLRFFRPSQGPKTARLLTVFQKNELISVSNCKRKSSGVLTDLFSSKKLIDFLKHFFEIVECRWFEEGFINSQLAQFMSWSIMIKALFSNLLIDLL